MKKTIILKQLLIALSFLFSFNSIAGTVENRTVRHDSIALKIHMNVTFKDKAIANAEVKVFLDNKEIITGETNKAGLYNIDLYKNQLYTIKISKAGFQTKVIQVSTEIPERFMDRSYKFDITTEMMKLDKKLQDEDALEFPTALIFFDEQHEKFEYDKKYTTSIKKEIRDAKINTTK